MEVEIKATGILLIRAENELEAYALRKWAEEYLDSSVDADTEIDLMKTPKYPGVMVDWSLAR